MKTGVKVQEKMERSAVNRLVADFRAALNFAYKQPENRIETDKPWKLGLAALKEADAPREHHFTEPQLARFLDACYRLDEPTGQYFEAIARLGCRPPSEIADLLARDFRPTEHTITIPRRKTKKRVVALPPDTVAFFKRVARGKAPGDRLFVPVGRERWTQSYQGEQFAAALKLARLPAVGSAYSLRHGFVSRSLERGMPIALLAEQIGTSPAMVARFYSHLLTSAKRKAMKDHGPRIPVRDRKAA